MEAVHPWSTVLCSLRPFPLEVPVHPVSLFATSSRIWLERTVELNFRIILIRQKANVVVDALRRKPENNLSTDDHDRNLLSKALDETSLK